MARASGPQSHRVAGHSRQSYNLKPVFVRLLRLTTLLISMTVFQAIVLGIVQGLTEFIPVSSSAHLIIIPWLFHWDDPGLAFSVALHLGTLAAVLWFFWADWVRLVRAGIASIAERRIGSDADRKMAWFLVIGTVPGLIAGALAESKIKDLFHRPGVPETAPAMIAMAGVIALLGAVLFLVERKAHHDRPMNRITFKDSMVIGLAQALAIFPGVSRSGSTITAGLAVGLRRDAAAGFSFLLGTPIIAGAGAKTLLDMYRGTAGGALGTQDLVQFAIGFITAAGIGYLCIRFMLRYLQKHSMNLFVFYRWALAAAIVAVALARM
jgi:undecaprenyl-diphosphatase